jgi:hypothetical protein
VSDRIVSWLRTVVPKLWGIVAGAVLVWLGQHAPWAIELMDLLGIDLTSPVTVLAVVGLAEVAWYSLWRWLEPRLPDALTRFLLGSAKAPAYAPLTSDGAHVITGVVDVSAPPGYEVPEVSDAKSEVTDWLGQHYDGDALGAGERLVEQLLALGWRPTRKG